MRAYSSSHTLSLPPGVCIISTSCSLPFSGRILLFRMPNTFIEPLQLYALSRVLVLLPAWSTFIIIFFFELKDKIWASGMLSTLLVPHLFYLPIIISMPHISQYRDVSMICIYAHAEVHMSLYHNSVQ